MAARTKRYRINPNLRPWQLVEIEGEMYGPGDVVRLTDADHRTHAKRRDSANRRFIVAWYDDPEPEPAPVEDTDGTVEADEGEEQSDED